VANPVTTTALSALATYVPRLVLGRIERGGPPVAPRTGVFPAAVLFADVSGFTALSERLMSPGEGGVEELTRILNGYFGELIDAIAAAGGDILKFAGDALLAVWPGSPGDGDLEGLVLRSAACGLALQRRMDAFDPGGEVRLGLRVAIGVGDVAVSEVGGVGDRWEVLVTGAVLADLGRAGKVAAPGEVVATDAAWRLMGANAEGEERAGGAVRLSAVRVAPAPTGLLRGAEPSAAPGGVSAFVPESVCTRVFAGQQAWLAELRRVSVVFVNLPGLWHLPLEQINEAVRALQEVVSRFEGSINKLSVDDKGVSLLAAWGLPGLTHEDDAVRATLASLEIQAELGVLEIRTAIGVASGRVFCGEVGNDTRREYTMLGDTVNLAARLMQAAPGAILCDVNNYREARGRVTFAERAAIKAKGKTGLLTVFTPVGAGTAAGVTATPLVGRTAEVRLLERGLDGLWTGESTVVVVEGEPGIGKSRLVQEVYRLARVRGLAVWQGAGDARAWARPYHAWRPIFAELLRLSPEADGESREGRVRERLARHPELEHLAPLLGHIVGARIPDNDATAAMTEQVRADNTQRALLALLTDRAIHEPLVLVIEDAHWLDSLSLALLARVHEEFLPCLVVVSQRPQPTVPRELARLLASERASRVILEPLTPDDALAVACQRLGVRALPPAAVEIVRERGEGHPLFSEELALALRDAGVIVVADEECRLAGDERVLGSLELPTSIEGIVRARVDRLEPSQQLALKTGSIIGRQFRFDLAQAIYPIVPERGRLASVLASVEPTQLLVQPAERLYAFRHAVTREVVYGTMLVSQRQPLHRAAAECLERDAGDPAALHGLLAYHREQAGDVALAVGHLDRAAEAALLDGGYLEAADAFGRAGALDAGAGDAAGRGRRWRRERGLGKAYLGLGRLGDARGHFEQALALLGHPMPAGTLAAVAPLLARVAGQAWRRIVGRPARGDVAEEERGALCDRIAIYEALVEIYFLENKVAEGFLASLWALELSEAVGPSPELARAYAAAAAISGIIPLHGMARLYADLAKGVLDQVADPRTQANARYPLGYYHAGIGDWERARSELSAAYGIFERLGDRRQWTMTRNMANLVPYFTGDFARCEADARELGELARRAGDVQYQAANANLLAWSLLRQGRDDGVADLLASAAGHLDGSKDHGEQMINLGLTTLAAWRAGDLAAAGTSAAAALALMARTPPVNPSVLDAYAAVADFYIETGDRKGAAGASRALGKLAGVFPVAMPRYLLCDGRRLARAGRVAAAVRAWRRSLEAADRLQMPYDRALAQRELGACARVPEPERSHHAQAAQALFEQLGAFEGGLRSAPGPA